VVWYRVAGVFACGVGVALYTELGFVGYFDQEVRIVADAMRLTARSLESEQ